MTDTQKKNTDFTVGPVSRIIIRQSIPLIVAQFVQLLYNVVDRIYIGHLPGTDSLALTGIGLVFPLTTMIAAFTYLFGTGGTPLFSIARGQKKPEKAERIMGNTFILLLGTSAVLMVLSYIFRRPILYLFGASDASYVYANAYLMVYLIGTPFSMIATGMNGFLSAQGFPRMGMLTTVTGALLNLLLDPLFLFVLHMGVGGAALATVISQIVSALWVLRFLTGKTAILRLKRKCFKLDGKLVKRIVSLGLSGFVMQATNAMVQVACNAMLNIYGGDLYIGVMTVLNSIREIMTLPVRGLTSGSQPVLGYNYGAKRNDRVKEGIRFMSYLGFGYSAIAWGITILIPRYFMALFTTDEAMIAAGVHSIHIYFFGFVFMAFQFAGQATFTSLGFAKHAVFFSLLRKAIIVVPLTILLPGLGFGLDGVFLAEPISNVIGGLACFLTMYFMVYRKLDDIK